MNQLLLKMRKFSLVISLILGISFVSYAQLSNKHLDIYQLIKEYMENSHNEHIYNAHTIMWNWQSYHDAVQYKGAPDHKYAVTLRGTILNIYGKRVQFMTRINVWPIDEDTYKIWVLYVNYENRNVRLKPKES